MDPIALAATVETATTLISHVMSLGSQLANIIQSNTGMDENDKQALIGKIQAAQNSIPEWK